MDRNSSFDDAADRTTAAANNTADQTKSAARRADDLLADNYESDALGAHDAATRNDAVGETTGGLAGALTGAALGSLGGPIGTIIGGIAGAVGGWWSGKEISIAASKYSDDDDAFYRTHYEASSSDRDVSDTAFASGSDARADGYHTRRPAYQLGHLAGQNPDYRGRSFDDVEPELQRGWTQDLADSHGDWAQNREHARSAFSARRDATSGSSGNPDSTAR